VLGGTEQERQRKLVRRAIERHSFCTLATSSAANRPHVVGVLYAAVDGVLYVAASETSIKVRNVRENPRVAMCIPVRRYPVGPPFSVQFQGKAEVCSADDPRMVELLEAGRLKRITAHGELEDPDTCFLRVTPGRRVATYGLGVPLRTLLRDPIQASRSVEMS
jgi:nitroimidazol reductase NimA-like FMN-containing flavoprotein (pyridoxamine 5'-phosphate oxidase superfamily)